MFDYLNSVSDEQAANGLAVRLCREVYLLNETTDYGWHAVHPLSYRLDAAFDDALLALKYAANKGWLDLIGTPVAYAKLLEPGRRLFANADVAFPKRAVRAPRPTAG
jgi:hypothetical protein